MAVQRGLSKGAAASSGCIVQKGLCRERPSNPPERLAFLLRGASGVGARHSHRIRTVPLPAKLKKVYLAQAEAMASEALRVLALAKKTTGLGALAAFDGQHSSAKTRAGGATRALLEDVANYAKIEAGMTLVGLVGLLDPPRPEVPGAMAACKRAGIRVIVITGDNQLTAEAICRTIGVLSSDAAEAKKHSITGRDFASLSKKDQLAFLGSDDLSGRVFSRAEPRHKQDIVRLLKECGEVTAMTGDGIATVFEAWGTDAVGGRMWSRDARPLSGCFGCTTSGPRTVLPKSREALSARRQRRARSQARGHRHRHGHHGHGSGQGGCGHDFGRR
mmetsp:Transcript_29202/g.100709  ORF Transcript_29202/g.100709 Transcript_29202/m.100709 type:complete len:332 (-) Transcript_29202:1110-2105(-)